MNTYRPFDELPDIVALARRTVECAGLTHIDSPRITDAVRRRRNDR